MSPVGNWMPHYTAGGIAIPSGASLIWRMNESSGSSVADTSGNGRTGTASAGATIGTGKYGNGRLFNGTSGQISSLWIPSPTTYSACGWIKPASLSGYMALWSDYGYSDSGSNTRIHLRSNAGDIESVIGNGSTLQLVNFGYTLSLSTWVHLAVTADNANARLYVNAVLNSTVAQTVTLPGTAAEGHFTVGNVGSDDTLDNLFWFNGAIDEVYVYQNTVLTQAQIQTIMNYTGP